MSEIVFYQGKVLSQRELDRDLKRQIQEMQKLTVLAQTTMGEIGKVSQTTLNETVKLITAVSEAKQQNGGVLPFEIEQVLLELMAAHRAALDVIERSHTSRMLQTSHEPAPRTEGFLKRLGKAVERDLGI